MNRVAVTGIGVVAAGAIGVDAFRSLLESGSTAVTSIERFATDGLRSHKAALIGEFRIRDFLAPAKARRMNTLSRYGVASAKMALDDSGADRAALTSSPVGVAVGTAFGTVQTSVEYMDEYVTKGPALAPPQLFAESVANAPGSHIAIENDFRGFNITITQRESSAMAASMYASSQIMKGTVSSAIIGGVDEINELIYSVLDRVNALAHAEGGIDEMSRPFDRRRNGLCVGEGGAALFARARPERDPYGWFAGFGMARDTTATVSDWGSDSSSVVRAMEAAAADAGVELKDIDAVYASANSNRRADRLEAEAIHHLFGEAIPVVATKGIFGEYAAAGSLHLASAFLALRDQRLHGSTGFEQPDDYQPIAVVRETRSAELRHIMINTISAGGGIVCAVLAREGG